MGNVRVAKENELLVRDCNQDTENGGVLSSRLRGISSLIIVLAEIVFLSIRPRSCNEAASCCMLLSSSIRNIDW